jgi:hypothetical protein
MKERIIIERLYSIGQFNNLRVVNEVTDIPQTALENLQAKNLLEMLMLYAIEKTYRRYLLLQYDTSQGVDGGTARENLQNSIEVIEEAESKTFDEFYNTYLNQNKETKNEVAE